MTKLEKKEKKNLKKTELKKKEMNEKKSEDSKKEIKKELKEYEKFSPICRKDCKVCSSGLIEEIHLLRKNGRKYEEILTYLADKRDFQISKASLSRHFQNYKKHLQIESAKIMNSEIVEEATKQATHQKAVVSLIDSALEDLQKRAEIGNLTFDISDLEKLTKLRYQILAGDIDNDDEILLIAQKAFSKYGVSDSQQVLFQKK